MKCKIIQADKTKKICKCGNDIFRCSTKTKYLTRRDKGDKTTTGVTYDLRICDKCNFREQFNEINWKSEPR